MKEKAEIAEFSFNLKMTIKRWLKKKKPVIYFLEKVLIMEPIYAHLRLPLVKYNTNFPTLSSKFTCRMVKTRSMVKNS